MVFDPSRISLVDILRFFWESHDPTQRNRQGNDHGTQYRSGAYYFSDEQRAIIEASKAAYEKAMMAKGYSNIATEVKAASTYPTVFYYAEDYHQQYLAKPGARPYCSAQPRGISLPPFEEWAPPALKEKYAPKLPKEFWDEYAPTMHCAINRPKTPIKWEL